jgi:hypothetical protein
MGELEGSRMRLTKGSQAIEPYSHGGGCPWRRRRTFMGTGLYFINSSYMSGGGGFGLRWLKPSQAVSATGQQDTAIYHKLLC